LHLINLSPWYWSTGTMIYTGFSQVSIYLHFSIFCWGYLVAGSGLGLGQLARAIRMARAVRCGPEIRFIKMICRMLRRMIRMLRHLRQTFSSASENQTWSPSTQRYDSCKDSWRTKLYRVKALTVGRGRGFFCRREDSQDSTEILPWESQEKSMQTQYGNVWNIRLSDLDYNMSFQTGHEERFDGSSGPGDILKMIQTYSKCRSGS